jgi:uncharacterized protein
MQSVLSIDTARNTVENKRKTLQCPSFLSNSRYAGFNPRQNPMKLHNTVTQKYQTITAYDAGSVEINAIKFDYSLLVLPEVAPVAWPVTSFDALSTAHFAQVAATRPDVVILGTGARQRFVHPRLIAELTASRIGVECMDNQAACRTYNILMAEGRKAVLALIFEQP